MRRYRYITGIFITLLILTGNVNGQEFTQIEDVDKLKEDKAMYVHRYPRIFEPAEITAIYESPKGFAKIQYEIDQVIYETIVNSGRKDMLLLETAVMVEPDAVPGPVTAAFKDSRWGNWTIDRMFEAKRPDEDLLYRLDISKVKSDGTMKTKSVYYDNLGGPREAPF